MKRKRKLEVNVPFEEQQPNAPPVTDQEAAEVAKEMSGYKDKTSTYWDVVGQAIHELNQAAK